jgi:hypothetical protein
VKNVAIYKSTCSPLLLASKCILNQIYLENDFSPDFILFTSLVFCETCSQCGGSGLFIPDPGSRIPDPKTAIKERGEKNVLSYLFM